MAVPKKGWRTIAVESRVYYWRAIGKDWGINVVVVTEEAFTRDATAQQLTFRLEYDHLGTPRGNGAVSLRQRAAVAPGVVRAAIEAAVGSDPAFTGELGRADVTLTAEVLATVQQLARVTVSPSP
jgi:hypothetical protein